MPVRGVAPRPASDRGASAVEFALIVPVFLLMVFGMIGTAFVLQSKLSLVHAADEAGRYGATLPVPTSGSWGTWLSSVSKAAQDAAGDDLAIGTPGRRICVAFIDGTNGQTHRQITGSGPTTGTCFADGRPSNESRVQVQVQRDHTLDLVLLPEFSLTVGSQAVTRYDPPQVP